MPTTNKRINITVPEVLYTRIQLYKEKNGITSDAAACIHLIKRQLDGIEETEKMLEFMNKIPIEDLKKISDIGLESFKQLSSSNPLLPGNDNN